MSINMIDIRSGRWEILRAGSSQLRKTEESNKVGADFGLAEFQAIKPSEVESVGSTWHQHQPLHCEGQNNQNICENPVRESVWVLPLDCYDQEHLVKCLGHHQPLATLLSSSNGDLKYLGNIERPLLWVILTV